MGLTDFNTGIMGYGPKWKFHRRIFQQFFRADASLRYRAKQTKKVNDYLNSLLDTPDKFKNHVQTWALIACIRLKPLTAPAPAWQGRLLWRLCMTTTSLQWTTFSWTLQNVTMFYCRQESSLGPPCSKRFLFFVLFPLGFRELDSSAFV